MDTSSVIGVAVIMRQTRAAQADEQLPPLADLQDRAVARYRATKGHAVTRFSAAFISAGIVDAAARAACSEFDAVVLSAARKCCMALFCSIARAR
jgi:hypothetical protein